MSDALELRISPQSARLLAKLETKLGRFTRFQAFIFKQAGRIGSQIAGRISREMLAGGRLKRLSGNLARSITASPAFSDGGKVTVRIGVFRGPARAYAGIQEVGTKKYNPNSPFGTIVPKKPGGYLKVPTDKGGAVTPTGLPRAVSGLRFARHVFKAEVRGKVIVARAALVGPDWKGRFGYIPPFLLLRKADLRPRYYLRDGLANNLEFAANEMFSATLKALVEP